MNEFFDNGGTTQFIDKVAGSLGIHASTIKVVGVYTGSVVVDYEIEPDKSLNQTVDDLKEIKKNQTEKFATGNISLGAPLLDVKVKTSKNTSSVPSGASTAPILSEEPVTPSTDTSSNSSNSTNSSSSSSTYTPYTAPAEEEDEEESTSIITGGVVEETTGFPPVILTRTPMAALIKFQSHFLNSLDMRTGEAKTCETSTDCGMTRANAPGERSNSMTSTLVMNMCCSDVVLTDTEDNTNQNIKRCMDQESVMYSYGLTIDGGYKVDMVCRAYATYLRFAFAAVATSMFAFIAI